MATIFFDESGYTGDDLLAPEQKTFVLASLAMPESECLDLKKKFFSSIKANELKFTRIKKYPKQVDSVWSFLEYLAENHNDKLRVACAHKELVGIQKIADIIVENAWHDTGRDFYLHGTNIAFSNALFMLTKTFGVSRQLIAAFSTFLKSRDKRSFDELFDYLTKLLELNKYFKPIIREILDSLKFLGWEYFVDMPQGQLCFEGGLSVQLISEWSSVFTHKFDVLYDRSKAIDENVSTLIELSDERLYHGKFGYDRRATTFPLKINKMYSVSSKDYAGIQLCDVIAGLLRCATEEASEPGEPCGPYSQRMSPILDKMSIFRLWPSQDVTPEKLGTTGPKYKDLINLFLFARNKVSSPNGISTKEAVNQI